MPVDYYDSPVVATGTQATVVDAGSYPSSYHHSAGAACFPPNPPYPGFSDECLAKQAMEATGAGEWTSFVMVAIVLATYGIFFSFMFYACFFKPAGINSRFVQFDLESASNKASAAGPSNESMNRTPGLPSGVPPELEAQWRAAFIGKVYSILGIQMFVTVVIAFCMMQFGGADLVLWSRTTGSWAYMTSMIGVLVTLVSLICFRHKYPHNVLLLSAFTLAMGFMVGMICTTYAAYGYSAVVLEAFAITSIMFVGLTAFTMKSNIDFSFLGLGIFAVMLGVLVWSLFAMFVFPAFVFRQMFALAFIFIFALFVVYDTWMISTTLAYDEYILGAINLYLDFINMFLYLLMCLTGQREN